MRTRQPRDCRPQCLSCGHDAFRDAGQRLRSQTDYIESLGDHSADHGHQTVMQLHAEGRPPTAILAGSSVIAHGVVRAVAALGLRIPQDISLIAYDGAGPLDLLWPPLTSVSVSMPEVAQRGVALLRSRRHGGVGVTKTVEVELVVRSSTSCPAQFDLLGPAT